MKPIKALLALQVALLALLSAPAGTAPPLPRGPEIRVSTNTLAWHYDPTVAVFPERIKAKRFTPEGNEANEFTVTPFFTERQSFSGDRIAEDGRADIYARLLR